MAVCVLLTVLCVGLYGQYAYTESCVNPVVTPASLMVEFGDPAEVTCSILNKSDTEYILGWESKSSQPMTDNETSVVWKVDSVRNWEEPGGLFCYFTAASQCQTSVNLTIYKRADSVKLSSVAAVWVEGDQTELKCEIVNVGPGRDLSVRWSRADPKLNTSTHFNETFFPELKDEMKNVSRSAVLHVTPSREDDGAQYRCTAVLNLHQTLEFSSQPISISVHYKPNIIEPLYSTIKLNEGERLEMICSAHGNPRPYYTWTLSDNTNISNSIINISSVRPEDQGQYTCTASNHLGFDTRKVLVTVREEFCVNPVVTPASLVVEFGDPAEVTCSIPNKPLTKYKLGWESKSSQLMTDHETSVTWKVDSVRNWGEPVGLNCNFTIRSSQCATPVNLTIYKRADSVKLSSVAAVWVEGDQTELKCEIVNVGPGRDLSVRWSRADPKLNTSTHFNETFFPELKDEMKNVSRSAVLHVTPSREDDGAQYRCTAVLNLHQTLEFSSQPISISVHSGQPALISVCGLLTLLAITIMLEF